MARAARFCSSVRQWRCRWEYDEGNGWQTDFDLVYTRVR
jgi:hypothetical protein